MNHCSEEQLLAWLDGELSPAQRIRVEKHVVECWRCRTAIQTLEEDIATVVRMLRPVEASHPPDRIALGRILSACNSSPDMAVRPSIARIEASWWPFLAVAAACVVFILVAMLAPSSLAQRATSADTPVRARRLGADAFHCPRLQAPPPTPRSRSACSAGSARA